MAEAKYRFSENDVSLGDYVKRKKPKQTGEGSGKQKRTGKGSGKQGNQPIQVDISEGSGHSDRVASKRSALPEGAKSASGTVQVTVPSDASAQTGYHDLAGELEKLLLSKDRALIKGPGLPQYFKQAASAAFSSYQHTLVMKEALGELQEKLQVSEDARISLKGDLRLVKAELAKGKTEWATTEAYLRGQLASNTQEIASHVQEIARLKAELAELKESKMQEIKDACFETAVQIRGTMSQQYLAGEHGSWANEANIAAWEQLQAIRSGAAMDDDVDEDDGGALGGE